MAELKAHLALTVSDVDRSIPFYRILLDSEPVKVRPGYAKFEPSEPALVLSLIEGERSELGAFNHGGIRVPSTDAVLTAKRRLEAAGWLALEERNTDCCFAHQDKIWLSDPDGTPWEVFTVLDDSEMTEAVGVGSQTCDC